MKSGQEPLARAAQERETGGGDYAGILSLVASGHARSRLGTAALPVPLWMSLCAVSLCDCCSGQSLTRLALVPREGGGPVWVWREYRRLCSSGP